MVKTKTYNVLLDTMNSTPNSAFTVNTNDLKTVKLAILINQDNDPLDLTDATVRLAVKKPDQKTVLQDATILDAVAGSCEIILDTQAYVIPGNYAAEIMVFYGTDTVAVTSSFTYKANRGIMNDDSIESTNEWQSITQAIADATQASAEANDAASKLRPDTVEEFTATAGQTVFTLANAYVLGKNEISVEIDGVMQTVGSGYTETSVTSITLSEGTAAGAKVRVVRHGLTSSEDTRFGTLETSLADIANPKKLDLADSKAKGLDIVDVIQAKIAAGYNWFIIPKNTRLNKPLVILNSHNIVFEGVGGFTPEFELNTGGIGVKVEGSSFVMFKNITMSSKVAGLTTPSKIGVMYTRSLQEDSCQWNNSDNLTVYMHTDSTANSGKGTIALYNCTAESQSYNNATLYADIPLVVTRTDIYNLAVKRSPSMKAIHFSGVTTLIASLSHALVLDGVSDLTFDNLYMAKDIFYGTNNEQYGCLITGQAEQGYENYNIVFLNYDCEEFASGFKVVGRLRHSKIFGNQHAPTDRIISVETAEAVMDSCEIDIQITNNPAVIDLVYFDSLCAGAVNSKFNMFKDTYRLTCNKPLMGCIVFANGKPNIVNNHGGHQSVNVFSKVGIGVNNNHINFSYNKPTPTDGTPFSSGMFPGNFAFNINTQVGSAAGWICNGSDYFEVGQVGYRGFDYSPTNVITPLRIGEEVFDNIALKWYKSVGITASDWRAMTI